MLDQIGNIEITLNNSVPIKELIGVFNKIKRLIELSLLRKIHSKNTNRIFT